MLFHEIILVVQILKLYLCALLSFPVSLLYSRSTHQPPQPYVSPPLHSVYNFKVLIFFGYKLDNW